MRNTLKNVMVKGMGIKGRGGFSLPSIGRLKSPLPITLPVVLLAMTILVIASCGGGGGETTAVSLTATFPARLDSIKTSLEAVGTICTLADTSAEVVAGPSTGEVGSGGSYAFQLEKTGSIPDGGGVFHVNFYYTPPDGNAQSIKEISGGDESLLVATLIRQLDSSGNVTAGDSDFDLTPDDDSDGMPNLDEVVLGLDPHNKDSDGDGVSDGLDVFPSVSTEWGDIDGDGIGDNTDDDIDGDGLSNSDEILYGTSPTNPDSDGDGSLDADDNCRTISNTDQKDTDGDGRGDVCEDDTDGDGLPDTAEADYGTNKLLADTDSDGLGDLTEINLGTDPLYSDSDGDGKTDGSDNCPKKANANQLDTDSDKIGDVCDADADNDGVANNSDNCPLIRNADQADQDDDDVGDVCDPDIDGDAIPNGTDNCPYVNNPGQSLTDADGDKVSEDCDLDETDSNVGAKESAIFVDIARGVDTNTGTTDAPVASIAAAITKAKSQGKNIYVAAGTYVVSNVVWQGGIGIFGGFNGDFSARDVRNIETIITRSDAGVTIYAAGLSNLIIGGFHIQNDAASADLIYGGRTVEISGGSVILDRNTIEGNPHVARSTAVNVKNSANVTLTRNMIDGGGKDASGSTSLGLVLENSSGKITNNIIKAGGGRFATGVELQNSSPIFVNNTIDGRSGSASMGTSEGLMVNSSSPSVVNNLIFTGDASNHFPLQCEGSVPDSSSMFKNNLLAIFTDSPLPEIYVRDCDGAIHQDANFTMGGAVVSGNIIYDATEDVGNLVDANYGLVGSGGNDGLNDGLDTRDSSFGGVTNDYNGTSRPRGATYDIGAVEN